MGMNETGPFALGLGKTDANCVPLTPISFLERAAAIHPNHTALVHGNRRRGWAETHERCRRLASALVGAGVRPGDTVSVMGANTPETYEAHFGVPMAGAVLNTINTRLDPATIAFILSHGEAKVLLTDREFSRAVAPALALLKRRPLVIDIDDPGVEGGELLGALDYETFLAGGDPGFERRAPLDEWDPVSLNYTSGTTGNPKGVVYSHRGAYLNAMSNALAWEFGSRPVHLWTLPMFHCNGWCFPWTMALAAGVNVCLRHVRADTVIPILREERVSHFCGAPIILTLLQGAPDELRRLIPKGIRALIGGAPPPFQVIEDVERLGISVSHGYGLTESYGAATVCTWQERWDGLPIEDKARLKSRQGVGTPSLEGLMVADPITLAPVPRDGATVGEVFLRGNNIMKGYLKNPDETERAFAGGWFHTGDLAVWHPDGYIEVRDRSKDTIISGGENISSLEVEAVLMRHPAVLEVAVVAKPDAHWGETPCAFVTLQPGVDADERAIIAFCRQHMAHYKVPRTIVFGPLPKTATGKVQKLRLRERARDLGLIL